MRQKSRKLGCAYDFAEPDPHKGGHYISFIEAPVLCHVTRLLRNLADAGDLSTDQVFMNLLSQRLPVLAAPVQFIPISEVAQEPGIMTKHSTDM